MPAITESETETTQFEPAKSNRLQPSNNLKDFPVLHPGAVKPPFSTSSASSNKTNSDNEPIITSLKLKRKKPKTKKP